MNKNGLFLWFCFIFSGLSISICHPAEGQPSFVKQIGESGISRGVTVEELASGGFILTGYTDQGDHGNQDVLLIKTDSRGETLWGKTIGGSGNDNGWAVRPLADGGYIVVGFTDSFGSGGMDVYLLKTNAQGDVQWSKTYGGEGDEYGWDVQLTRDKGFIIAAQTNSLGNGSIDAYLIKVDSEGQEIWSSTYGGTEIDRIFSVQETDDGGFVAAGITYSFSSVDADDRDGYLLKTNSSGVLEWSKSIGGDSYDVAHCVALTEDGGYLVTGYGASYTKTSDWDLYLIKTNERGETSWLRTYGGPNNERGIKGRQTEDGGFIAIGATNNDSDLYLVRTNKWGGARWTRTYGLIQDVEFGYTIRETRDKGFILLGHVNIENPKVSKVLLIKTDHKGRVDYPM